MPNNRLFPLLLLGILLLLPSSSLAFPWTPLLTLSPPTFASLFLPPYLSLNESTLNENRALSRQCKASLNSALQGLHRRSAWAAQLFNSWASLPPTGTLSGTLTDLGDYDQCLAVEKWSENGEIPLERTTQYCLLDLALPMPQPRPPSHNLYHQAVVLPPQVAPSADWPSNETLSLQAFLGEGSIYRQLESVSSLFYYTYMQIGICLPADCSPADVQELIDTHVIKYGLNLHKVSCTTRAVTWNLNWVQWMAILFIFSLTFLAFIATVVDYFSVNSTTSPAKGNLNFLQAFSPLRNVRRLFSAQSTEDDLACVHGLRVLTLLFIIIGHTLDWNSLNMFRDTFTIRDRVSQLGWQPLYRGQLTVDTFFYLSGLLTSYMTLKYTSGSYSNFSSTTFLCFRYLRLTPQLGAFILLSLLLPALFDGPVWRQYTDKLANCYDNWWINLLYAQNIVNVDRICALHTWFLGADMQLHCLALLPVIALLLNRNIGLLFAKIAILLSLAWSSLTVYRQNLPPGAIITSKSDFLDEKGMPSDYLKFCYHPLTHAHVFFVGFLFGDYIQNNRKKLKSLSFGTNRQLVYWFVALAGYLFTIYSMLPWLYGRPYTPLLSALIFPLNLLIWSSLLTLVIWLCITSNGGPIGALLSHPLFRPLSRMTYCVYLVHSWVLLVALGTRRSLIDLRLTSIILLVLPILFFSFLIGLIFTVMVECPLLHAIEWVKQQLSVQKGKSQTSEKEYSETSEKVPDYRLLAIDKA